MENNKDLSEDDFKKYKIETIFDKESLEVIANIDVFNTEIFNDNRGVTGSVSFSSNDYTETMNKNSKSISNCMV
ncbi:MAG: hypothetical protein U9Q30_10595 [Campylobacterota bacterium]|nr:hypothetical protein [Campylobacterota bacterium]